MRPRDGGGGAGSGSDAKSGGHDVWAWVSWRGTWMLVKGKSRFSVPNRTRSSVSSGWSCVALEHTYQENKSAGFIPHWPMGFERAV